MKDYRKPNSRRTEYQHQANKARGGKLVPTMAVPFRPNEKGIVSQTVAMELEPIAGRLITDIYAKVTAVFVPALACDALYDAAADHPGNAEIFRTKLLNGEMIFPLEGETEISQRLGINPKSVGGSLVVNSIARIAHNAAVNFLRQRKYVDAATVLASNTSLTPAILSSTVLDRFNAVLNPEDRINGAVALQGTIPIQGLGLRSINVGSTPATFNTRQSEGVNGDQTGWFVDPSADGGANSKTDLMVSEDPDNPGWPLIVADLGLTNDQRLSLSDFYQAEKMDKLTRAMRAHVDRNPQHGVEQIVRMVHGLSIETGKVPYVVYEKTIALANGIKSAMDGASLDVMQTNTDGVIEFSVPVDGSEFGGILITFLEVKPEEVVNEQPHPVLTEPWEIDNLAAQELAVHPVSVPMRDLDSNVAQVDEETVAFWVGPQHFRRRYENYGFNRGVDTETVDHKSAMWRYALPLSVSPESVIYPTDLDHYPFSLNAPTDDAVSYSIMSAATIASPTILGPSPVEDLSVLDDENVFDAE